MKQSKTNSGILNLFEKIVRSHPLLYFITRYFIRFTNIFEQDANGVSYINFSQKINIIMCPIFLLIGTLGESV